MGMRKNAIDNAVFTVRYGTYLLLLLSNIDDVLILSISKDLYIRVRNKIKTMFDITAQEGNKIKFLNLRIVSFEHAATMDQTKHILSMVEPFFPRLEKFSRKNLPMRTDNEYECEYASCIPATKAELALLEVEFGGSYLTLYGKLLHVATISRPQFANALSPSWKISVLPE